MDSMEQFNNNGDSAVQDCSDEKRKHSYIKEWIRVWNGLTGL